jgi:hypothetical protein
METRDLRGHSLVTEIVHDECAAVFLYRGSLYPEREELKILKTKHLNWIYFFIFTMETFIDQSLFSLVTQFTNRHTSFLSNWKISLNCIKSYMCAFSDQLISRRRKTVLDIMTLITFDRMTVL